MYTYGDIAENTGTSVMIVEANNKAIAEIEGCLEAKKEATWSVHVLQDQTTLKNSDLSPS